MTRARRPRSQGVPLQLFYFGAFRVFRGEKAFREKKRLFGTWHEALRSEKAVSRGASLRRHNPCQVPRVGASAPSQPCGSPSCIR